MDNKEVFALINLLDDPDEDIFQHVKDELFLLGEKAIPVLQDAWESSFGFSHKKRSVVLQSRIEDLIHAIQFTFITKELTRWIKKEGSLLDGTQIIAKYQYPDLDQKKIKKQIELIKEDVQFRLKKSYSPNENIQIMNKVFFDLYNYRGNTQNFHAPQNSFINDVLETKTGNPLSLCILYIIIGRMVGLPLYGINLPKHFIACYKTNDEDVEFYINPFSRGAIFNRRDITDFLKQLEVEPKMSFFQPCSNVDMIERCLVNLDYSYQKLGYLEKLEEIRELMKVIDKTK